MIIFKLNDSTFSLWQGRGTLRTGKALKMNIDTQKSMHTYAHMHAQTRTHTHAHMCTHMRTYVHVFKHGGLA